MAQQESNQSRPWVWGIVAVLALAGIVWGVRAFTHHDVAVRVGKAEMQDITSSVSTNGKVEPVEDFQAHAPMPGVVQRLLVGVGDRVRAGEEIIRMDASDAQSRVAGAQAALQTNENTLRNMQQGGTAEELLTAKADMTAAETAEKQASTSLISLQELQSKGAASANEVAAAQQRLADAQAKVAQLKARKTGRFSAGDFANQKAAVAQARSSLLAARSSYAAVVIHTPISGTVYSVPISQFDYVQNGEALLNVADLNRIRVRAYFDEPEIGKLSTGQPVKIVWDAKPNQAWHGHIQQAPTTVISYGTRNVGECIIAVDDARGDLLPNTNVTATVTTLQRNHVLSVPREALHTSEGTNYVYKIVSGRLQRVPVKVGAAVNLTRVEIAGGLNEGDAIVLGASSETELADGMEVKAQS